MFGGIIAGGSFFVPDPEVGRCRTAFGLLRGRNGDGDGVMAMAVKEGSR